MAKLLEYLALIPAVIWSGVVGATLGATITLFGIWRQNIAHAKRQKDQLEHDATQRHLERVRSLQREIYLAATEAVVKWQTYLISFANIALPQQEHRQIIQGAGESVSKAFLIGSANTMQALNKLNVYFSENALRLEGKRIELNHFVELVSNLQSDIQNEIEKRGQLLSSAETAQKSSDFESANILINEAIKSLQEIESLQKSVSKAERERDSLVIELIKQATHIANEFGVLSMDAIIFVRRELGLELDNISENAFKTSSIETAARITANASQWVDEIKQKFGTEIAQQP
jgi:hypothetical protein